ncbi:MAG: response regulator transcription factor [Cytophagaceae bacterium]|nr:response regulator transcription factor [Cytophagaceae bacterium]
MKQILLRTFLAYGLSLGSLLALMTWAKYRLLVADHATELYVLLVAVLFISVGIWAGLRWSAPRIVPICPTPEVPIQQTQPHPSRQKLLERHGISPREWEVLVCLAQGLSNEEIAQKLFVSANTVKTHLGNVYSKLNVSRRTQAIEKARTLGLLY